MLTHRMNTELVPNHSSRLPALLVGGFAATAVMGAAWFITHLPWLELAEHVAIPTILACWLIALTVAALRTPPRRAIGMGFGSGLVSGITGLVFFGTKLGKAPDISGAAPGVVPDAPMLVLGFLGTSILLGAVAGVIARLVPRRESPDLSSADWLARFALVTLLALAPLVVIGGLVTSTGSGMAVPDWPRTYGMNMFLFPLSGHVAMTDGRPYEQVYVEHAHRLFGAFVGLTTITLLTLTCFLDRRAWVKWLAFLAFVAVCVQGVLGGARVLENSIPKAMLHGVLAQLTLALVAALATVLTRSYRSLTPRQTLLQPDLARRIKLFCTLTLHSVILQLLLGAAYRHFHHKHILYTHIALSIVVLLGASIAGFTLASPRARQHIAGAATGRLGLALALFAGLQFLLGWLAFAATNLGTDPESRSIPDALVRTAHQANGGAVIALAAACFVWGRRLGRARTSPE